MVSGIPDQIVSKGELFATIALDNYVTDVETPDADIVWTYSGNSQLSVSIVNRIATITKPTVTGQEAKPLPSRLRTMMQLLP